jgi:hypothetical protein
MDERNDNTGYGVAVVRGPDGAIRQRVEFHNLITTKGDEYQAKKIITGISPASASAPTAASGMKLGTGTTAAAKSGAGAALVTYESGSNQAFDATYPQAAAVTGTDTGWGVVMRCTWGPGDVTETALTEAVIVNDAATNATSTAANTYARATFDAINKAAGDTLEVLWYHKQLGV